MSFVEESIGKAGFLTVLEARRAGDVEAVRSALPRLRGADLLVLGAIADLLRAEDVGVIVHIHETAASPDETDVAWVAPARGSSELDVLREIAIARISAGPGARVGIDWSLHGLELAQVALGFGASDLRGPITRKSGLPIFEDEKRKVKGQGMVDLVSIRRREIEALVTHSGRVPRFVEASGEERVARSEGRARAAMPAPSGASANPVSVPARESSQEVSSV